jgi:hypothetical protein
MNKNEFNSGPSSVTTSSSAPAASDSSKSAKPALTESQFLAEQASAAQEAMQRTWADIKHTLGHSADVRAWTKKYPWLATATAVAAGVATGYALTPRDKNEFQEMWEAVKDKLTPSAPDAEEVAASTNNPPAPSILSTILKEAIKLAGPLVTSYVAAATGGAAGSNNGHADGAEASSTPNPS